MHLTGVSVVLGVVLSLVVTALFTRIFYEVAIRDHRLPPGPRRYPLIGNIFQGTKGQPIWILLKELADKYGPIFSIQIWDQTCIILADQSMFKDLLDKRGSNYSDRPRFIQAKQNLYQGKHILLRNFQGEGFREHRRAIKPVTDSRAAQTYAPVQEAEVSQLLVDFLDSSAFSTALNRYAASIVSTLAYGHRVSDFHGDGLMKELYHVQDNTKQAFTVGLWAIDWVPALNWLPTSLAPWKAKADEWRQEEESMRLKHMTSALQSKTWNWTKQLIGDIHKHGNGISELDMAYNLGIMVDAGTEPTTAVLHVFILAALLFPNFVKEAQKELDTVIGTQRTPTLADKAKLTYVNNCVKETFRWRSALPLAFPHQSNSDDEYMGYRIPAGSVIAPLQWYHNLNPNVFEDPELFEPARWTSTGPDYFAFGFGPRQCPGMHIAKDSIFLAIANMLWGFNVSSNADLRKVLDNANWSAGFLTAPPQFEAQFTVRSPEHKTVILKESSNAAKDADTVLAQVEQRMSWR